MNTAKKLLRLTAIYRSFSKRRDFCRHLPLRLWVEASSCCNLQCTMCPNAALPPSGKRHMPFPLFQQIIDEAKGVVHDVNLHHRGEPLLNPDIPQMIDYAKKNGLNTRLHTNATLLNRERASDILNAGPDLISISFDGFTKEAYETVRKGAAFEETVTNILNLLHEKKKKGAAAYIIVERIDFTDLTRTADTPAILALEKRFKDSGIDEIITKQQFDWAIPSQPTRAEPPSGVCTFPWYTMVICSDGTVTPCPQDYMAELKMGSVTKKSLAGIWNDSPYRNLRKQLTHNIDDLPLCRNCDRLQRHRAGGVPYQYLTPFLLDVFAGYGTIRKRIGSFERNHIKENA